MRLLGLPLLLCLAACCRASVGASGGDGGGPGNGDGGDAGKTALGDAGFDAGSDGGPQAAPCARSADCESDGYCADGGCVPWPDGGFDPTCAHLPQPAYFSPSIRCAWPPPDGDGGYLASPDPLHYQVITTPLVADFGIGDGGPLIVFPTQNSLGGGAPECVGDATDYGILRLLDPRTCSIVATLDAPDQHIIGSSTPAIGDLDGDGRPEIVAASVGGGLVAFHWDGAQSAWVTLWHSSEPDGGPSTLNAGNCEWAGPSIADVNGDGLPEVVFGGVIHDRGGRILGESLGMLPYSQGQIPVLANVDLDGGPELLTGDAVYGFDPSIGDWALAPYFAPPAPLTAGFTAVGRFGSFPLPGQPDPGYAQVAVASSGTVRVETIDGRIVFGPYALPGSAGGGPPTVGDFNGDGQPDIAVAGSDSFTVFSFHCVPADGGTLPADCAAPGVLWTRPSQDHSSNITGSSLFDFTGAGTVDGIYADECFARVYDGPTGDVVYSQWHSSCTWYENPVVADVLGNYSSQLIVISNQNCNIGCSGSTDLDPQGRPVDKTFDGLHCQVAADCPSANATCAGGLCRCTSDDDCCGSPGGCPAQGFVCAPPPDAGAPALGNTCRAYHGGAYPGIRVYADAQNRWVDSRPIWNQHAYAVTNVNADGTIPAASKVLNNWQQPGLNNFRENVQGSLTPLAAADLTAAFQPAVCGSGSALLSAEICNRGAAGVASGIAVAFVPQGASAPACTAQTSSPLGPGQCEPVSCNWSPAPSASETVVATVDPAGTTNPCDGSGHSSPGTVDCVGFK
ncbi:MAG: FG-GAP repeat domain-containing protein [Myxococcales bacterium]